MMEKQSSRPSPWAVSWAVARVTFLELLREKVLYNVLLVATVLLTASVLATQFTFIQPGRVVTDIGMSAMNLSCSALAILLGSYLLNREFERRTIFVALSRPISRGQFLVGKYLGLAGVLGLNWFLLCLASLACLAFGIGAVAEIKQYANSTYFVGLLLLLFQALLLGAVSVCFSALSSTAVSIILSIGVYLAGTNVSQFRTLAGKLESGLAKGTIEVASTVLPNLEHFNLGTKIVYQLPVSSSFVVHGILYGVCFIGLALAAGSLLIRNKES